MSIGVVPFGIVPYEFSVDNAPIRFFSLELYDFSHASSPFGEPQNLNVLKSEKIIMENAKEKIFKGTFFQRDTSSRIPLGKIQETANGRIPMGKFQRGT